MNRLRMMAMKWRLRRWYRKEYPSNAHEVEVDGGR